MTHRSKVAVTGGAGFIGSRIVERLLNEGFEVIALDNLQSGKIQIIKRFADNPNLHFMKMDICDFQSVKDTFNDIDVVFHEAAVVDVQESLQNPLLTNRINVEGTLTLLQASVESDVKRFIYASSCAVYGDSQEVQLNEGVAPNPISPYAVSKLAAENYVRIFHRIFDLETVCLRYFNVYGSENQQSSYSGVINAFINKYRCDQRPIIYGNGEQTRDFVHVDDVVEANMLALENENSLGDVINIGTGVATSINQLAIMLAEILNKEHLEPIHIHPRDGDIQNSCSDISKAKEILRYKPGVSLKNGLKMLVKSKLLR